MKTDPQDTWPGNEVAVWEVVIRLRNRFYSDIVFFTLTVYVFHSV